jgi:hypothetical protein
MVMQRNVGRGAGRSLTSKVMGRFHYVVVVIPHIVLRGSSGTVANRVD